MDLKGLGNYKLNIDQKELGKNNKYGPERVRKNEYGAEMIR